MFCCKNASEHAGSFRYRFDGAGVAEVVQNTLLSDFLDQVLHHVKVHEVVELFLRLIHSMIAHLHELVLRQVSKPPWMIGIKAAGKALVGSAKHGCYFVFVARHDDGAILGQLHLLHNGVQNLIQRWLQLSCA